MVVFALPLVRHAHTVCLQIGQAQELQLTETLIVREWLHAIGLMLQLLRDDLLHAI